MFLSEKLKPVCCPSTGAHPCPLSGLSLSPAWPEVTNAALAGGGDGYGKVRAPVQGTRCSENQLGTPTFVLGAHRGLLAPPQHHIRTGRIPGFPPASHCRVLSSGPQHSPSTHQTYMVGVFSYLVICKNICHIHLVTGNLYKDTKERSNQAPDTTDPSWCAHTHIRPPTRPQHCEPRAHHLPLAQHWSLSAW